MDKLINIFICTYSKVNLTKYKCTVLSRIRMVGDMNYERWLILGEVIHICNNASDTDLQK